MYIQFTFYGSNPYVATTNRKFFDLVCKYGVTQIGEREFFVDGLREWNGGRRTYEGKKELLRSFAKEFQDNFPKYYYSFGDVVSWQEFFEEYGRKYGLLREFKENAIV